MISNICYNMVEEETLKKVMNYRKVFWNGYGHFRLFRKKFLDVWFECDQGRIGVVFHRACGKDPGSLFSSDSIYAVRWDKDEGFLTEEETRGIFCKIKRVMDMLEREKQVLESYGYIEFSPFRYRRISQELLKNPILSRNSNEVHFRAMRRVEGSLVIFENKMNVSVNWPNTIPSERFSFIKGTLSLVVTDVERNFLSMMTMGRLVDPDFHLANIPSPLRDSMLLQQ